jgi:hypothetical protein
MINFSMSCVALHLLLCTLLLVFDCSIVSAQTTFHIEEKVYNKNQESIDSLLSRMDIKVEEYSLEKGKISFAIPNFEGEITTYFKTEGIPFQVMEQGHDESMTTFGVFKQELTNSIFVIITALGHLCFIIILIILPKRVFDYIKKFTNAKIVSFEITSWQQVLTSD